MGSLVDILYHTPEVVAREFNQKIRRLYNVSRQDHENSRPPTLGSREPGASKQCSAEFKHVRLSSQTLTILFSTSM